MKKRFKFFWLGAVAFSILGVAASTVWGNPRDNMQDIIAGPGNGGDIPTPFLRNLPKMELASGEVYSLVGKVKVFRSQVYFEIDFNSHPYLESRARKEMPFYPLKGSIAYWKKFEGQRVKVSFEARGRIQKFNDRSDTDNEESLVYIIELIPLSGPIAAPQP